MPAHKRKKGMLTRGEKAAILADLECGLSWRQIVAEYGVSKSTIARVRQEATRLRPLIEAIKEDKLDRLHLLQRLHLENALAKVQDLNAYQSTIGVGITEDVIQKVQASLKPAKDLDPRAVAIWQTLGITLQVQGAPPEAKVVPPAPEEPS